MSSKIKATTLGAAALFAIASSAYGDPIVYDSFSYPTGAITGDNGGNGWANAWTSSDANNPNQVTAGGLTFSANGNTLVTAGNKLTTLGNGFGSYRQLPTVFGPYGGNVNQDIWIGFLTSNTPQGATSNGYGGLSLFQNGVGETFFVGAQTDPNSSTGQEFYGFRNLSPGAVSANQSDPFVTSTPADTTTHFLVTELSFTQSGATEAQLYIDPTPGVVPTQPADLDYTFTNSFQFDELRFQSGGTGTDTSYNFDEIRMGTTYQDVAPEAPEPSGRVTLLVIGALLGVCLLRRRRTTPPE